MAIASEPWLNFASVGAERALAAMVEREAQGLRATQSRDATQQ
jgi:hypothetical protein